MENFSVQKNLYSSQEMLSKIKDLDHFSFL